VDHPRLEAHDLSAIIVAGGRSRRMGHPKPWLPLAGVPLITHVAARVQPLVREIVIVAAAGQDLPSLAARVVRDREPGLGPLPALALGLETVTTPYAFALGCDTPFVVRAVLQLLAEEAAGADAAIPVWQDRLQPLVALYHRRMAPKIAALAAAGERRLRSLASLPDVRLVPAEHVGACDPTGASFRTLNTPKEYAAALDAWTRDEPAD
jgi:molybdopterin-guanine dinucleotide biosynthesis protein A